MESTPWRGANGLELLPVCRPFSRGRKDHAAAWQAANPRPERCLMPYEIHLGSDHRGPERWRNLFAILETAGRRAVYAPERARRTICNGARWKIRRCWEGKIARRTIAPPRNAGEIGGHANGGPGAIGLTRTFDRKTLRGALTWLFVTATELLGGGGSRLDLAIGRIQNGFPIRYAASGWLAGGVSEPLLRADATSAANRSVLFLGFWVVGDFRRLCSLVDDSHRSLLVQYLLDFIRWVASRGSGPSKRDGVVRSTRAERSRKRRAKSAWPWIVGTR